MMALLVALLLLFSPNEKQTLSGNDHVTVEMSSPAKLVLKSTAGVSFLFTPKPGIHVNTQPAVDLRLEKDAPVEISGTPQMQKNAQGYLETQTPVIFTLKAKSSVKPGRTVVRGKINYFFCSEKDGWCNRYSQPVEFRIEIIP